MARHGRCPELRVRSASEAARIAPRCLAGAYERLVPIMSSRASVSTATWRLRPLVRLAAS